MFYIGKHGLFLFFCRSVLLYFYDFFKACFYVLTKLLQFFYLCVYFRIVAFHLLCGVDKLSFSLRKLYAINQEADCNDNENHCGEINAHFMEYCILCCHAVFYADIEKVAEPAA